MSDELRAAAEMLVASSFQDGIDQNGNDIIRVWKNHRDRLKDALAAPPDVERVSGEAINTQEQADAETWRDRFYRQQLYIAEWTDATECHTPNEAANYISAIRSERNNRQQKLGSTQTELVNVRNDRDAIRARLRKTCQTLVSAVGADGPFDADEAAEKLIAKLATLTDERDQLRRELEKVNALAREFGWGQGELDEDLAGCLRKSVDRFSSELPATYYAGLPDIGRLRMLVMEWRGLAEANQRLEAKLAAAKGEISAAPPDVDGIDWEARYQSDRRAWLDLHRETIVERDDWKAKAEALEVECDQLRTLKQRLIDAIPPRPQCRDCADDGPRCQTGDLCDPIEMVLEWIGKYPQLCAENEWLRYQNKEERGGLNAIAEVLQPNYSNDMPLVDECIIAIRNIMEERDQLRSELAEAKAKRENDAEAITEDWLRSMGFEISIVGKEGPVGFVYRKVWQAEIGDPCFTIDEDGDVYLPFNDLPKPVKTRGDVRQICEALGIELKEPNEGTVGE